MSLSRYSVVVPQVDALGNPLRDIAQAVHHHLSYGGPMRTRHVYIDANKRGSYPHDVVVAHADESPENDSHIKQMAGYIGDLTNHPMIHATKHGKAGMQAWDIANRLFRPGQPAEDLVLQPQLPTGGALVGDPSAEQGGNPAPAAMEAARGGNPLDA